MARKKKAVSKPSTVESNGKEPKKVDGRTLRKGKRRKSRVMATSIAVNKMMTVLSRLSPKGQYHALQACGTACGMNDE